MHPRDEDKTTRIFEQAIYLICDLPEDHKVYITGAHYEWLCDLRRDFKETGLVGVEVITAVQISNGYLRGCKGRLLIDDIEDLNHKDLEWLLMEKQILEKGSVV